jgi:N-glycosylase/DNA lyase
MSEKEVVQHFKENIDKIESRLEDFRELREASDTRLFQELAFVIFSSQSQAENAWRAAEELGKEGLKGKSKSEIEEVLRNNEVSYEKDKSDYIAWNRHFLSQPTFEDSSSDLKIKDRIRPDNLSKSRKWFAENIKGIGWKGASHFLRNIGYGNGFAILSTHTVAVLYDLGVLDSSEPPNNREEYLEMEEKMLQFSEEVGIDIKALDLVLWSMRTGEVFK